MNRYICYDYETTGLNPNLDNPTEIGAVDNLGNKFQCYVKVSQELSKEVQQITGLNMKFLNENGEDLEGVIHKFKKFIFDKEMNKNCKTIFLIAHNGSRYDHIITNRLFAKYSPLTSSESFNLHYLDTFTMCKLYHPEQKVFKLGELCKNLCKYEAPNSHRALDDAISAQYLFNLFLR